MENMRECHCNINIKMKCNHFKGLTYVVLTEHQVSMYRYVPTSTYIVVTAIAVSCSPN